ncbi:MAG: glycosyltransferase family 1 protein [Bacteroidota bacterium]
MRILYDDEIFFRQRFGGVSRIFTELIRYVKDRTQNELLFDCGYSENEYLVELFPHISSFLKPFNFPLKGKLIRKIYGNYSHFKTNKRLIQNEVDIFHPSFYADYYLKSLAGSKTKLVFTVHDLIHERYPVNNQYRQIAKIKEKNLRVAHQIIVVSEYTKKDLLNIYPFVKEELVHVIPLAQSLPLTGIDPGFFPGKYILFTGERGGYKNFETLLNSFAKVHLIHKDLYLFCAGGRPFNTSEKDLMSSLHITDFVLQKQLTDAALKYGYQHARLFVFPSLYEGFGIPALEAFAAGTPVILSNRTSLPEVGGNAALYADCADAEQLAQAILSVLENETLKGHLIQKGYAKVEGFTWKKHAEATLKVYQKALQ